MSNFRFRLLVYPEYIYNNLHPDEKEQFDHIEIAGAALSSNGVVEIECLALEDETIERDDLQVLTFEDGEQIYVKDF